MHIFSIKIQYIDATCAIYWLAYHVCMWTMYALERTYFAYHVWKFWCDQKKGVNSSMSGMIMKTREVNGDVRRIKNRKGDVGWWWMAQQIYMESNMTFHWETILSWMDRLLWSNKEMIKDGVSYLSVFLFFTKSCYTTWNICGQIYLCFS